MARVRRVEVFCSDEVAAVHVISRVVRQCFLLGQDFESGKNYDYRKLWIEQLLERFAASFGIDLIAYSLMSNHMHQVLRSRPDVVATWDDTEVARRWLTICPIRKRGGDSSRDPTEAELNSIRNVPDKLVEIRRRLSDISWWMRLLCQRIALRANREDDKSGHFWQGRFKAVRLLDEAAILACAAYVDLNPIRAKAAKTIEESDFTSAQRRARTLRSRGQLDRDDYLCPVAINEQSGAEPGPLPCKTRKRCSDKGFTALTTIDYLELLDWTARQVVTNKPGATPGNTPSILKRLKLQPEVWCTLACSFGRLFGVAAGQPHRVDEYRTHHRRFRFKLPAQTRVLLTQ